VWKVVSHIKQKYWLRDSENRVLRTDYGFKKEEVTGRRTLCNEELHNFYSSTDVIRVIKLRGTRLGKVCDTHEGDEKFMHVFCLKSH
jgi:hypothetical protein